MSRILALSMIMEMASRIWTFRLRDFNQKVTVRLSFFGGVSGVCFLMPFMILVVVVRMQELGDAVEDDDVVNEAVEGVGDRVVWDNADIPKVVKEMNVSGEFC